MMKYDNMSNEELYPEIDRDFTLAELDEAVYIISLLETVTDSILHKKMKIPYIKAYKIIDYLEKHDLVSIQIAEEDRDVYVDDFII